MKLNPIFLLAFILIAFGSCSKNESGNAKPSKTKVPDSVASPDPINSPGPVDNIVGTYSGMMRYTSFYSFHNEISPPVDTTYPVVITVTKVAPDSFRADIYRTYKVGVPVKYDSSGFYSSWFGGYNYNELFFWKDSLRYGWHDEYTGHYIISRENKGFLGKKN